jgi:hypothetical protein
LAAGKDQEATLRRGSNSTILIVGANSMLGGILVEAVIA